jgi:hypothetical protein
MKTNRLVVCNIPVTLPIANKKFWVETPSNHRCDDNIVITIGVYSEWYLEKLSSSTRIARSILSERTDG